MPRLPRKTILTGFEFNDEKTCFSKNIYIRLKDKYSRKLYPVCPILQEVIGKEKPSITKVPKTNDPLLDSIIRILVVFESLMKLKPNLETVVKCAHTENFLKEWIDLIRNDWSTLPQGLEKDYPDTSRNCKELVAELKLAEFNYTMNSDSLVYFLPDDLKYGNWATFLEWRERQIRQVEHNSFLDKIEMNRLTCHYPAEAIKVINKIYRELRPLVKILSEKVQQSNKDKIKQSQMLAGLLQKSAETNVSIATRLKRLAETSLKSPKRIQPQEFHNVCYQLKLEVEEATQGLDEILFKLREKNQSGKADAIEKLLKKLFQLINPESQKRSDNLAPLYLELNEAKNCAITLADKINQITGTEPEVEAEQSDKNNAYIEKQRSVWVFGFNNGTAQVKFKPNKELKGLALIEFLLRNKNKEYTPLKLLQETEQREKGEAEPEKIYTDKDIAEIKGAIEGLESRAKSTADLKEKARFEEEIKDAEAILHKTRNCKGKSRKFSEKYTKSVSRNIETVLKKIAPKNVELYNHLDTFLNRGEICCYKPDKEVFWEIS